MYINLTLLTTAKLSHEGWSDLPTSHAQAKLDSADVRCSMHGMPHLTAKGDAERVGVLRHDELRHVRQRHGRRHRLLHLCPGFRCLRSHTQACQPSPANWKVLHAQLIQAAAWSGVCTDVQDTLHSREVTAPKRAS